MLNTTLTFIHVASGTLALIVGFVALLVRKGGGLHINFGLVFVVTMGASSFLGAILGLLDAANFYITFHAGILGVTFIASSWLTVRADRYGLKTLVPVVTTINLANGAGLLTLAVTAAQSEDGRAFGFAASSYGFLFGMTAIAAIGDLSLIVRKALSSAHRIARHLWRMCLAFFIAAGSAFTGPGAAIFPQFIQDSGVLALPELLILLAMLFWLAHTYWMRRKRA